MYNYNHLYYFYITVKSGGVTAASEHLKVSQPSLSSQLKVLEGLLDIRLFRRVGRNNELTEMGSVIFGYCRRMFELSEEMAEMISKKDPSVTRRIHIGVSEEVDRPFVVEVVSRFLKKHGIAERPKVTVVSGDRERLIERLRFRELDAVVTELAMSDPDLADLASAEAPVALMCSPHWKPERKSGTIKEILGGKESQWVLPSPKFKLRSETNQFIERYSLKGRVAFESDVVASLVRSVIDEIGLAFLPLLYVTREIREKSIRVLGPPQGLWKYKVWLSCHHQNRKDSLLESLSESFREVCSDAISSKR